MSSHADMLGIKLCDQDTLFSYFWDESNDNIKCRLWINLFAYPQRKETGSFRVVEGGYVCPFWLGRTEQFFQSAEYKKNIPRSMGKMFHFQPWVFASSGLQLYNGTDIFW